MEKQTKLALNPFDDKRLYLDPVKSLPWDKHTQAGDCQCILCKKFIGLYYKELTQNRSDQEIFYITWYWKETLKQLCCVAFDDMLDSNQKLIDPFFTRGRHNDLNVYYLSQSYFDLPLRTIRNNSSIIILVQQTLKGVIHIYSDIAGFNMSYAEFKSLCREAWKENIII